MSMLRYSLGRLHGITRPIMATLRQSYATHHQHQQQQQQQQDIGADTEQTFRPLVAFDPRKNGMFTTRTHDQWLEFFEKRQQYGILGHLKFNFVDLEFGLVTARIHVEQCHQAPNGFMHAATHVLIADTAAGFGCYCHLPSDQHHFTTVELKQNFFSSAKVGDVLLCKSRLVHSGSSTQVWDSNVWNESTQKLISSFRCTQIVLQPREQHVQKQEDREKLNMF